MTVEPSCPATASGSGSLETRSHVTRTVMKVAAMARFAMTNRWARFEIAISDGRASSSSRTMMASAVSRARSEPCRPIAIPVLAAAMARASLTPSPISRTRWPTCSSLCTAVALSAGSRRERTLSMPVSAAIWAAARWLSPVSR